MKITTTSQKLLIGLISIALTILLIVAGGLAFFLMNGGNSATASAEQIRPQPQESGGVAIPNQQVSGPLPRTITVVGEGVVTIDPDTAHANIGVDIVGNTVEEANDEAGATMDALFTALEAQGIAEADIQTTGYNIWIERPYGPAGPPGSQGPGDALYHVNNLVSVVIRDLDSVDDVLNAAIEAGANNIHGVTFQIDDSSQLTSEARALAVEDAEARAAELAGLNQVSLGEVVSVSEVIGGGLFPNARSQAAVGFGGGGGPIAPGQLELSVQLQITYMLE